MSAEPQAEDRGQESIRMFVIAENELAELERLVPRLAEATVRLDQRPRTRVLIRRIRAILGDIRWREAESRLEAIVPASGEDVESPGGGT